eukprot:13788768-Ditylum_brightwellii.AAC.1
MRWIPFFEIKVTLIQDLIKIFPLDCKFVGNKFNESHQQVYSNIKTSILSKPILKRADPTKQVYLKTNFSAKGLGFVLCQLSDNKESLAAVEREIQGGECKFDIGINPNCDSFQ